jgi:hypothetical protein
VNDRQVAHDLAQDGHRLIALHTRPEDMDLITRFDSDRDRFPAERIASRWHESGDGVFDLKINEDDVIRGVPEIAKNCRIGGYPVIEKWLNGREGRELSVAEVDYLLSDP